MTRPKFGYKRLEERHREPTLAVWAVLFLLPTRLFKLGGGGTGKVAENIVEMKSLAATVRDAATGRGQFKPGFRPTQKDTKKSGATPAKGGRPKGGDKDVDAKFSVD